MYLEEWLLVSLGALAFVSHLVTNSAYLDVGGQWSVTVVMEVGGQGGLGT